MEISLAPAERVLVAAKIHWLSYVRAWLIALFVFAFAIFGMIETMRNNPGAPASALLIWIVIFLCGLIPLLLRRLENASKIYVVTNQRLFVQEGFFAKASSDIPIGKINDISMYQTLWQRIVGAGDITVLTGNDVQTCFKNIADPQAFRDSIAKTR